jgi:soluble lytic murein transglycosylase-like protein
MSRKRDFGLGIAATVVGLAVAAAGMQAAYAGSPDTKNVPAQYEQWVRQAAGACNEVNGPLIAAQIEQESSWNPDAVSSAGAVGIAQFKPDTWAAYGVDADNNGSADPKDPADAIVAQGRYMCFLAGAVNGVPGDKTTLMLWAYNAGPEAVKSAGGNPPTAEADNYAKRILNELVPKYRP